MWHLDIPNNAELRALAAISGPAVVSIYLPTTPITPDARADALAFRNLVDEALAAVAELPDLPRRGDEPIAEQLTDLIDDEQFWATQAHGLGVITTAEHQWTFRLPQQPRAQVTVGDRPHLLPLLAAASESRDAHVLCLSEGAVRLVDVAADLPPQPVEVPELPRDAAAAVGKSSLGDRSHSGRIVGSEGKKVRIRQYARAVDEALRPLLHGDDRPLVLIAPQPINSIFRQVCSAPSLADEGLDTNADIWTDTDVAEAVRPVLVEHAAHVDADLAALVDQRAGQRRVATDLADIARAATYGAVATLVLDRDFDVPGSIADDGTLSTEGTLLADELARRVFAEGGEVLALASDRLPGGAPATAILRYPL